MFGIESGFADSVRLYGRPAAVEVCLDIHKYTELHSPKESVGEPKLNGRQLFDFNEHFIELGSPNGNRSTDFMVFGVLIFIVMVFCYIFALLIFKRVTGAYRHIPPPVWAILFTGIAIAAAVFLCRFNWYSGSRAMFFTALVARFRFNRTTGKVYVLRPKKFGGNAVLDWNCVKAHIAWLAVLVNC
jgi:hypothetical protein